MNNSNNKKLCELCTEKLADKSGSHFTPASLIQSVVGKKYAEEVYSISSDTGEIKQYFGRSNLKNTDPIRKENIITKDNVFCKSCEDLFGRFESKCSNPLNMYIERLIKGHIKIFKTTKGQKYFEIQKIPKQILKYYFYSIVWRQCVEQKIGASNPILASATLEQLRNIIFNSMFLSDKELIVEDETNHPDFIVFTTYHKKDTSENFYQPNIILSNPKHFFLATYGLLFLIDAEINKISDIATCTGITASVFDNGLCYKTSKFLKIGVLNESNWNKINKKLVSNLANSIIP